MIYLKFLPVSVEWSALILKCISSDSMLFITWKYLKSAYSALNSVENEFFLLLTIGAEPRWFPSEIALFSDGFRMIIFGYFFNFSGKFRNTSVPRHKIMIFNAHCEKKWKTKKESCSIFSCLKDVTKTQNLNFFFFFSL